MKFRILKGKHAEKVKNLKGRNSVKMYYAGTDNDIIESDIDLANTFANKFALIEEGKKTKKESSSATPVNVTADFPTAQDAGLEVYKVGKKWNIVDPDDSTEVAIQVNKGDIDSTISDYLSVAE